MKSSVISLSFAVMMVAVVNTASAGAVLTVSTDQSGGNTQIDIDHTSYWNFTIGTGVSFDDIVGSFVLKRGNNTSEDIVFSLWEGSYPSSTLLASDMKSPSDFPDQSYGIYNFNLSGVNIGPGDYSLTLASLAATQGSMQYFIKGDADDLIFDQPLIDLTPTNGPLVPEPTSLALAGFAGLGMLGGAIRRRRAAKFSAV